LIQALIPARVSFDPRLSSPVRRSSGHFRTLRCFRCLPSCTRELEVGEAPLLANRVISRLRPGVSSVPGWFIAALYWLLWWQEPAKFGTRSPPAPRTAGIPLGVTPEPSPADYIGEKSHTVMASILGTLFLFISFGATGCALCSLEVDSAAELVELGAPPPTSTQPLH